MTVHAAGTELAALLLLWDFFLLHGDGEVAKAAAAAAAVVAAVAGAAAGAG